MYVTSPERNEVKGHTLKKIRIRLDYHDIIQVSTQSVKEIQQLCAKINLTQTTFRALDPYDFEVTDIDDGITIPYEYLKDLKSRVFLNEDQSIVLEINQFFMQVTQNVLSYESYIRFSEMETLFNEASFIIKQNEGLLRVRKVSVQKINEIYYRDMDSLALDFNKNYLGLEAYEEFVDWNHPVSKLQKKNSFTINDSLMEVLTVLDNGQIEENTPPILRLILQFDNHLAMDFDEMPAEKVAEINDNIYKIFLKSFTSIGQDKIVTNQRLGELW